MHHPRGLGFKKSPGYLLHQDYKHVYGDRMAKIAAGTITLPTIVDYTSMYNAVRDQGTTEMCVAYAGAAIKEYEERKKSNITGYFAPAFIYNQRSNIAAGPASGMYCTDMVGILERVGDCRETLYDVSSTGPIPAAAMTDAAQFKVASFAVITDALSLKTALYLNGPCFGGFNVYNYSMQFWQQNSGDTLIGGHGIAIIGYNDTTSQFTIRNSWGTSWGNNGYTYLPYASFSAIQECLSLVDNTNPAINPTPPVVANTTTTGCC